MSFPSYFKSTQVKCLASLTSGRIVHSLLRSARPVSVAICSAQGADNRMFPRINLRLHIAPQTLPTQLVSAPVHLHHVRHGQIVHTDSTAEPLFRFLQAFQELQLELFLRENVDDLALEEDVLDIVSLLEADRNFEVGINLLGLIEGWFGLAWRWGRWGLSMGSPRASRAAVVMMMMMMTMILRCPMVTFWWTIVARERLSP